MDNDDLSFMRQLTSCDFVGDEGCCDPDCWRCHSPLRPENLRTLAENLRRAAALCEAFDLGGDMWDVDARIGRWRPGCGKAAP